MRLQSMLEQVLDAKGFEVHSASPGLPVSAAVARMHEHNVGALLVLEGDAVVGIFTERDVLYRVVDGGLDPATTLVSGVMTRGPWCVSPTMTVVSAMAEMTARRIRHLPVIEDGSVLGLISSGDLTRWVTTEQREEIRELEQDVRSEGSRIKSAIVLAVVFIVLIIIGVASS